MAKHEITVEMNAKPLIEEAREIAQALNEFADNIERIDKKYTHDEETAEE